MEPGLPESEVDRLLHVVIVGGGPTGVEFGAELYDFLKQVCLLHVTGGRTVSSILLNVGRGL